VRQDTGGHLGIVNSSLARSHGNVICIEDLKINLVLNFLVFPVLWSYSQVHGFIELRMKSDCASDAPQFTEFHLQDVNASAYPWLLFGVVK